MENEKTINHHWILDAEVLINFADHFIFDLVYKIRCLPHAYLTREEIENINDALAVALKREKELISSIDYLCIEFAASGYTNPVELLSLDFPDKKNKIQGFFNDMRKYKALVEEAYYSTTVGDVIEFSYDLRYALRIFQDMLNHNMELLSEFRNMNNIPIEKITIGKKILSIGKTVFDIATPLAVYMILFFWVIKPILMGIYY